MSDLNIVNVVPVTLEPHPNADSLSLVRVYDGYVVCVRTQDWIGVDRGAYIPPDNVVPDTPEFSFLDKRRIKAKKFRGIMSQGLLVPAPIGSNIGDDVTEILGVKRYIPEADRETNIPSEAETSPPFPGVKYDVESWFKYKRLLPLGTEVVVTEKIHGTNARYTFQQDRMWVASRSFYRKYDEKNIYWSVLKENPWIETFCRNNPGVILYGEIYGWVQDLKYGAAPGEKWFRAFDVLGTDGRFWDFNVVMDNLRMALSEPIDGKHYLEGAYVYVPILYRGVLEENTIEDLMNGKTTIPNTTHVREGVVVKPINEMWDDRHGRIILKAVSPEYLSR